MSWNNQYRNAQNDTGVQGLTGAAPQTGAGGTLGTIDVEDQTLSALVYAKATTNTLTITAKWQGSNDGSTFYDIYGANSAAFVAQVTGTGSAVTATRIVEAPKATAGWRFVRCIVVTGTGVGGGAGTDEYEISYNYTQRQPR